MNEKAFSLKVHAKGPTGLTLTLTMRTETVAGRVLLPFSLPFRERGSEGAQQHTIIVIRLHEATGQQVSSPFAGHCPRAPVCCAVSVRYLSARIGPVRSAARR
jgi:hypothetical protein